MPFQLHFVLSVVGRTRAHSHIRESYNPCPGECRNAAVLLCAYLFPEASSAPFLFSDLGGKAFHQWQLFNQENCCETKSNTDPRCKPEQGEKVVGCSL
jgi:hypothetical protein